jgi:type 2A phosphatase activator TIP41
MWQELDESGMRMSLLTDVTVPILFFDEVVMYEDDLHDNGQVSLTAKIRVMPSCAYVLSRLYCRVDEVVVRCRESRVLVDFFGMKPQVYRDVSWRECYWNQLAEQGLPTDVRSWRCDVETPAFNDLLKRLPEVVLPKGIHRHAVLVSSSSQLGLEGEKEEG